VLASPFAFTSLLKHGKRPAPQVFGQGIKALVKADLGTKRVCPSCGARFYDLSRKPIVCPKCGASFEPEALFKQRRQRQPEAAEVPEKEAEVENDEDVVETVEDEPELVTSEEEVAHPHVEPDHSAAGMSVVDAEDVTIEDIEDEPVEEDEEDDALLEPDEGDEDDVSGIIDADIEKDER
jgi:uncharacterized protein (TIGR02300 family)